MSSSDFEASYQGTPPWEIGAPQPAIRELIERGRVFGRVLDAGCGTGENALLAASRGLQVVGIDGSATAITRAKEKAKQRGLTVDFHTLDALRVEELGLRFDTVIDSGLFHVFSDDERRRYVRTLSAVLKRRARVFILCFSEFEPTWGGPRRVTQEELRAAFLPPYSVEEIVESRYETNRPEGAARAWLAEIRFRDYDLSEREEEREYEQE
jgi:SAM-dependent methyltransferase